MRKYVPTLAALALTLAAVAPLAPVALQAQHMDRMTMVGGQMMSPRKTIVDNAVNSADHTTLVAAVKAAGLVPTLEGTGPFTVFAPTNAAFDALPAGTVSNLLKPENKPTLVKILTYHVIAGDYTAAKLMDAIRQGGGTAELTTVQGEKLTFRMNGPRNIVVIDAKGNAANISTYDVMQSNGVIQVIDRVLMP
jgi:uncharacterized surface protein with fasciclin (FAS1) repeats